jgi:hypothetical protein
LNFLEMFQRAFSAFVNPAEGDGVVPGWSDFWSSWMAVVHFDVDGAGGVDGQPQDECHGCMVPA